MLYRQNLSLWIKMCFAGDCNIFKILVLSRLSKRDQVLLAGGEVWRRWKFVGILENNSGRRRDRLHEWSAWSSPRGEWESHRQTLFSAPLQSSLLWLQREYDQCYLKNVHQSVFRSLTWEQARKQTSRWHSSASSGRRKIIEKLSRPRTLDICSFLCYLAFSNKNSVSVHILQSTLVFPVLVLLPDYLTLKFSIVSCAHALCARAPVGQDTILQLVTTDLGMAGPLSGRNLSDRLRLHFRTE